MREQVIKDLEDFYSQLTNTKQKFRGVNEEYELFECSGNYVHDIATTIFVRTKNTKKVFMFNTLFNDHGNAVRFKQLMDDLNRCDWE